ncbi:MAG: hypothetical protein WC619_01900 [Patescibacteria group bacterium]
MFNLIKKQEKKEVRKKQGLLDQLKKDMSAQYAFNPPNRQRKKEINALRLQYDIQRDALVKKYQEEVDELTIQFMREEINILKRVIDIP